MKTLVTGAHGFIGRNLVVRLRRSGVDVAEVHRGSTPDDLRSGVRGAAVVFHLAGMNRPAPGTDADAEFAAGNVGSIDDLSELSVARIVGAAGFFLPIKLRRRLRRMARRAESQEL